MADSINTRVKRHRDAMKAQGMVPIRVESWCSPAQKAELKRKIDELIAEATRPA